MKPLTDTQIWGLDKPAAEVECPLKIPNPYTLNPNDYICPDGCRQCLDFELENYPQITQMDADGRRWTQIKRKESNEK